MTKYSEEISIIFHRQAQKFHPSLNENRKYFSFCWLLRGSAPPLVLPMRQPMTALGCCKAVKSSGSVGVCLLPCYSISLSPERREITGFFFPSSLPCVHVGVSQGFGYNSWYISLCYTLCHHSPTATLVSASAVPLTPSLRHKENSARREIKKVEKTLKREGKK